MCIRTGGYAVGLSPFMLLLILAGLSRIFLPITLFLLVVSVIQEESLVGNDQFWLTRPYERRSLALEKLLFILVWAVLPMLLHDVFVVRHFGFSLSSAFGLLLWKTFQFGVFLVVAAAVAVLSASFGRAVLLAIVTVLVTAFTFFIVMQNAGGPPMAETTEIYIILAIIALAAVGAVCVITFQYRFRIASVAGALGVLTILACSLLVRFSPSSLTAYLSKRYALHLLQSVQILPDASLTGLTRPTVPENADVRAQTIYYPFHAEGLASDIGVAANSIYAEFSSPGQKHSVFYLAYQLRFQPNVASRLFADADGPDQLVPLALRDGSDSKALGDTEGTMSGQLFFDGYRSSMTRVPVPLPYKPQSFAIAGRRCSVEAGHREAMFILRFDCVELEPGNTSRMQVHLLQDRQEIIPQGSQGQSSSQGSWPSFLSPIIRTGFSYEFSPQASADFLAGEPPKDREMLVFAEEFLGKQERPFRIEHFRPFEFSLEAWQQRGALHAPEHHLAPFVLPPGAHPRFAQ